jgi:hypothetical protein
MNHQFFSPQIHVAADALPGLGIASANRFSIVLPLGSASAAQDQTSVDYTLPIRHLPSRSRPSECFPLYRTTDSFRDRCFASRSALGVTVDIYNDTATPEQLHCRDQKVTVLIDN